MPSPSVAALPTGASGRWAALGLLAAVLAAAWLGAAAPLLDWYRDRAETLEQRATLARRMAQVAASLPELERAAQADRTAGPQADAVLTQPSDAVAAAAVLQAVQDMAARAGAPLSSTETLPAEAVGAYRRLRLRIVLSAPLPAVAGLLQALDQARPRMLVDDLQLRAAPVLAGRGSPPLDASMLVMSFRRAAPAP